MGLKWRHVEVDLDIEEIDPPTIVPPKIDPPPGDALKQ